MSISLRMLNQNDAEFILALVNDPLWLRFIGDRQISNVAQAMAYIRQCQHSFAETGIGLWCVDVDGQSAGLCGFVQRDYLAQPDLGFALLPQFRGQGVVRNAIEQAFKALLQGGEYRGVSAITAQQNLPCIKVLSESGFRLLGYLYRDDLDSREGQLFFLKPL